MQRWAENDTIERALENTSSDCTFDSSVDEVYAHVIAPTVAHHRQAVIEQYRAILTPLLQCVSRFQRECRHAMLNNLQPSDSFVFGLQMNPTQIIEQYTQALPKEHELTDSGDINSWLTENLNKIVNQYLNG